MKRSDGQYYVSLMKALIIATMLAALRLPKSYHASMGGDIKLGESQQGFVNLSSVELTDAQRELLNLGLNCHVLTPNSLTEKKAELELLYQDIIRLEKEKRGLATRNGQKAIFSFSAR